MVWRDFALCSLLLAFASQGVAENSPVKSMTDIHKICIKSPAQCLIDVNQALLITKEQSRVWYDLTQYKIESLFLLQNGPELYAVTKPWINIDTLPVPFKVSIYIYYAKSLAYDSDTDGEQIKAESRKYIKKAEQQLDLINSAYPDPMLLIQLANIKMFVGDHIQAYQSLQSLEVKYKRRQDPAFKLELYANLAHLADRLAYKKEAIDYWLESVYWAIEHDNDQQIATVYFNLAQSQVTSSQREEAKQNYLLAIDHATLANDWAKKAQSQYFLANALFNQGLTGEAKKIVLTINASSIPTEHINDLNHLKSALYQ